MGISLAPPPVEQDDPNKPKPVPKPTTTPSAPMSMTATPALSLAPQSPGQAGGAAPMTAPASITPGIPAPTVAAPAAPVDRVKLATDTFNNTAAATDPAYQAAQRGAVRQAAGLGQLASGGLRTTVGNLQLQRERDLDAMRKDLVNKATEGSIADATTAYQQGLAGSQQALAERVANSQIGTAEGSLGIEKEKLGLAKEGQDLQSKVALGTLSLQQASLALDEQVKTGQMSLAQRDQALRELQSADANRISQGSLDLERQKADIAARVQSGQLSIAQGQLELARLQASDQNRVAQLGAEAEQQRIQLQKDQLEQQGKQFGLSLAQSKELATLADKTANRQLDVSTAQGQNSLLLELARIMGSKDLTGIDPNFLKAIAASLGMGGAPPPKTTSTTTTGTQNNPTGGDADNPAFDIDPVTGQKIPKPQPTIRLAEGG